LISLECQLYGLIFVVWANLKASMVVAKMSNKMLVLSSHA
jgi:hypothetical protein